jgi:thiol-disulfide isomerase/thioredoxin
MRTWASIFAMSRLPILCVILLALSAFATAFAETKGEVSIGETLPDAFMQGLNGPSKQLSEFRGMPLIINVWASWCAPCRAEMASLERLAWMPGVGEFGVIGISTDDYPERARAVLKATNATISHFIDSRLRLENMLGASRIPLTVLVDEKGRVLDKIYGARQWDSPESLRLIATTFGTPESGGAGAKPPLR